MLPFAVVTPQTQTPPADAATPPTGDEDTLRADASTFLLLYDGADESLPEEAILPDREGEDVEGAAAAEAEALKADEGGSVDPDTITELFPPIAFVATAPALGDADRRPDDIRPTAAARTTTIGEAAFRGEIIADTQTGAGSTAPSPAETPATPSKVPAAPALAIVPGSAPSISTTSIPAAPAPATQAASAPLAAVAAPPVPDHTDRIRLDGIARDRIVDRAATPAAIPPADARTQTVPSVPQPTATIPAVDPIVASGSDQSTASRDGIQPASPPTATLTAAAGLLASTPLPTAAPSGQLPVPPAELPARFAALVDDVQGKARDAGATAPLRTEIELAPATLGRIRVTLETGERGLHLAVVADQPQTVEIVRRQLDILHRALVADGVAIDRVELGATPRQSTSDSNQGQSTLAEDGHPRGDRAPQHDPARDPQGSEGEPSETRASLDIPPPMGAGARLDLRL